MGNFKMAKEDFPALGVQGPGGQANYQQAVGSMMGNPSVGGGMSGGQTVGGQTVGGPTVGGNPNVNHGQNGPPNVNNGFGRNNGGGGMGSNLGGLSQPSGQSGLGGLGQQQPMKVQGNGQQGNAGAALPGEYGLLGLLSVIRMSDPDRNTLSLGSDLTSLGLQVSARTLTYL